MVNQSGVTKQRPLRGTVRPQKATSVGQNKSSLVRNILS